MFDVFLNTFEQVSKIEILRKLKLRFGGKTIHDARFRIGDRVQHLTTNAHELTTNPQTALWGGPECLRLVILSILELGI